MSSTAFQVETGVAAPMPAANIDTDVIMPKQFLKRIDRAGLKDGVFHDLRFAEDGSPLPEFPLHQPRYANARFLVTGANFGCGSSREHAVWGLRQLGIRAILAESFAGIFADNAARNGLLLLTLPAAVVAALLEGLARWERPELVVDLPAQQVRAPDGSTFDFPIDPSRKAMLQDGLDAIGLTLTRAGAIADFESTHLAAFPWLARSTRLI